jgi:glycosyltransferase involved in cell wall biosynthesis
VLYTTHESTVVPQHIVREANRHAALLYVPCRQNIAAFRDAGVEIPIRVLPHGIDPAAFPYLERARRGDEPFTFGTFGELQTRKGIDVLLRAFRDEFGPREPVRLVLKDARRDAGRGTWDALAADDEPRVVWVRGFLGQAELLELLRDVDAFVLPSRGEGFGLAGLEAMATGLPLIATNWSGPADYLDPADSYLLDYELVDARGVESSRVRFFGQWAEPSYEHLRALLRHVYEQRAAAAARGRAAAQRVHSIWTWERAARQIIADLDALAAGITPV